MPNKTNVDSKIHQCTTVRLSTVCLPLTHAGPIFCFGHANWAAVETLVSSLCVTALLVSRAHISHALIDICKMDNNYIFVIYYLLCPVIKVGKCGYI